MEKYKPKGCGNRLNYWQKTRCFRLRKACQTIKSYNIQRIVLLAAL